jgi:GH24 family phage-related lysozyme (muramidase)
MWHDIETHEHALFKWLGNTVVAGQQFYATCPLPVRLALLDMVFNLGEPKLRKLFVNLRNAVQNRNWLAASEECKRKGPSRERNAYTQDLFLLAAKLAPRRSSQGSSLPSPSRPA